MALHVAAMHYCRPALNGFEIIEQLEKEFGLQSYPINWPIGSGDRWAGGPLCGMW